MDGKGFDDFTRRLATAESRRTFLKAVVAAVAGVVGLSESGAARSRSRDCRKGNQRCTSNQDCCSGVCLDGPGKHRDRRQCAPCTPEPESITCDGTCGVVANNCGDRVKCPKCCNPEKPRKTCSRQCGPVTNNCGEIVECEPCPCEPDDPEVTCSGRCGEVANNCGDLIQCGQCPCVPDDLSVTCAGRCGAVTNNCELPVYCGECPCVPNDPSVACGDGCGDLTNNCGDTVNCGLCPGDICVEADSCGGGECLEGSCCADADVCQDRCCDPDRGEREACCGGNGCCECFQNNSPGGGNALYCGCEENGRELCGTYPDDSCCLPQDTCVDGICTPKPQACPPQDNPGGPNIYCNDGCCGGICCPAGTVCDGNKQCVAALTTCNSQADCDNTHLCTAFMGQPGICCPNVRYFEAEGTDGETTFMVPQCCSAGSENRDCDLPCVPVYYEGCSATFRGSQPRITS